jgi:hypothetical protein
MNKRDIHSIILVQRVGQPTDSGRGDEAQRGAVRRPDDVSAP